MNLSQLEGIRHTAIVTLADHSHPLDKEYSQGHRQVEAKRIYKLYRSVAI